MPNFHSTTHECLGVAAGWMEVEFFGRDGFLTRVSADNVMVGGYPDGCDWDNIQEDRVSEDLRRAAAKRIMMRPIPAKDPVTGLAMRQWIDAPSTVDAGLNDFRDGLDDA